MSIDEAETPVLDVYYYSSTLGHGEDDEFYARR